MHSPVAAPTVHGERSRLQCFEPLAVEVLTRCHRNNDGSEGQILGLLRTQEGLTIEKRDDSCHKIVPVAHHQHKRGVARTAVVLANASAAEPALEEIKDLSPLRILADVELRHELPTNSCARVPLNCYVKRTFSVDEASKISIQPFLLIVRTDRIFTAHAHTLRRGCDSEGEYCRILGVSSI